MKKILLALMALAIFTACGPSRDKRAGDIEKTEKRLFGQTDQAVSKEAIDSLMTSYEAFIQEFPDDTLSPVFLFKAGGIAMNSGNAEKAVASFDRLMKEYPAHEKAALGLFFKGFVQENLMQNLDQARETYLLFVEKYPDNEFADDARASVENLGKTPEQMIREFEAKQKADSAAAAKKK